MTKLAIKGHATRGEEVIEILEMLGGSNPHNYCADCDSLCFTIGKSTNIIYYDWVKKCYEDEDTLVFTLEEFLEKYPYKVGDRVKIPNCDVACRVTNMIWNGIEIEYETTNSEETVFADELQPYKEQETMEELKINLSPAQMDGEQIIIPIPKGYEFAGVDDDNQQVVFEKIGCQYPKTYEECYKILNMSRDYACHNKVGYKWDLITNLQKLLICRDAYWKIAGWNPKVKSDVFYMNTLPSYLRDLFPMPAEEMRDAFYEHFKDLIERCKELL